MKNKYRAFYLSSVGIVLFCSAYPLYMLCRVFFHYWTNGAIRVTDYPKYVIPYGAICFALVITACVMPLLRRLFRRACLPAASILGLLLFFICELLLEQIPVTTAGSFESSLYYIDSWQYLSCVATPEISIQYPTPLIMTSNPTYKIHFYLISILMILAVIGVLYQFTKMFQGECKRPLRPLVAQLASVSAFIVLCVWACFTAFYRTGGLLISPLSAVLMCLFFVVFGLTAGTYIGSLLYGRKRIWSVLLPALVSMITTCVMYFGELMLMGGTLYRFGTAWVFQPLDSFPLAPIDLLVIIVSGGFTWLIMLLLNQPKYGSNRYASSKNRPHPNQK